MTAHAKFQVVAYNMLKERGAITVDPTGRVIVNDSFPQAISEVTGEFLKIQADGNRAAAEQLLKIFGAQPAEIAKTIEELIAQNWPRRTFYETSLSR